MNKKIYLLPLLMLALVFASCEETKEADRYVDWRARNEAFMDSIQNVYDTTSDDGGLNFVFSLENPSLKVFYKDITPEETVVGDESPFYTDSVSVFRRGTYINGDVLQENFSGANPTLYDAPVSCGVSTQPWSDVVQQKMTVGKRFLIYIPWQVGAGQNGYVLDNSVEVRGYSTLIYDLQLVSIIE